MRVLRLHLSRGSNYTGAGYTAPAPVSAAQGQILTFFVDGVGTSGLTATLHQGSDVPAPIIDVQPIFSCAPVPPQTSCGGLIAVTVQIPYELIPLCPLCDQPIFLSTQLIVTGNGHSATIELNALTDQVHVLTVCDIVMNKGGSFPLNNNGGLPCSPIVTHGNGSMVTASSPANPGEMADRVDDRSWRDHSSDNHWPSVDQAFAYGADVGNEFQLHRQCARAKRRSPFLPAPTSGPAYSGLAPGFVGLYQINFVVPPGPPNGIAQCALPGTYALGSNPVLSNLTVSFGGGFSFDGVGICVATRIPVD